jgi:formylglycine-generating enzyme required for sulfatase activity
MKRRILILLAVLCLTAIGGAAWTVADPPPVRLLWRYGLSGGPEPTGQVEILEGVKFVEIGPGCFRMGSEQNADGGDWLGRWCAGIGLPWGDQPEPSDEMPVHWVEIPRGFYIAVTEVTNAQYEAFDNKHQRNELSPGDRDPVVDVTFEDAKKYCAWLSERSGREIRLPSESEWECACRAGSNGEFCFGDDEQLLGEFAWYDPNSKDRAQMVGTRRANAFGLFDFHGNVWEWCEDAYHEDYENAPADGTAWTEGGVEQEPGSFNRIIRGGCFVAPAANCRSAYRNWNVPGYWLWSLGFRPAFSSSGD